MENLPIISVFTPEYINNIVKIQSMFRKYLSNKNNIYILSKKFKTLQPEFDAVIKGYHMINRTPIKESVWEEIN
jgi:hypothetical protein